MDVFNDNTKLISKTKKKMVINQNCRNLTQRRLNIMMLFLFFTNFIIHHNSKLLTSKFFGEYIINKAIHTNKPLAIAGPAIRWKLWSPWRCFRDGSFRRTVAIMEIFILNCGLIWFAVLIFLHNNIFECSNGRNANLIIDQNRKKKN